MPVSKETLDEVALSEKEYQLIVEKLGREPSEVELGIFGSLWSEQDRKSTRLNSSHR